MIFNSLEYAAFLPIVVLLHWRLPHRGRLWLLVAASYAFYGWWDARFLGLLVLSTVVDFTVARRIAACPDDRRRLQLFLVSVAVNLGILGFFKYYGFFVDSAEGVLARMGIGTSTPVLDVLLPVGISFYTFQTLGYSFDVYRRRIEPTDDLVTFAVYVAFFPQLVAGPIERARHLLPQFQTPRERPRADDVSSALLLIGQGLVKKVVIADGLAPLVNETFATSDTAGWLTTLVGVYAFAFQIYGDFSGYTDIARGSARLLGVDLMRNFTQPYLSRSITEFWRHWHISLSTWLRDYLYVPLGGNRSGRWATYRNLLLTMLLGGLWHGAAWTFVAWGGLHGLYLVVERALGRDRHGAETAPLRPRDLVPIVGTFHLVCLAWILFRATSFDQAVDVITGIVTLRAGAVDVAGVLTLLLLGGAAVAIDLVQRLRSDELAIRQAPVLVRGTTYGLGLVALVVWSGGAPVPFIYFQF